jgi:DNA primase small subunit
MINQSYETIHVVRQAFREFYYNNNGMLEAPEEIGAREFGYSTFNGVMVRHLSFKSINELYALLIREVPSDVYSSTAYYTNPTLPMEEKGLRYADLIFDIDIKELNPPCSPTHDVYMCERCSNVTEGRVCNACNMNAKRITFSCDSCIELGKREVKKILAILEEDLGIDRVKVYFSGNYGFHIHVKGSYLNLDSKARSEIANYVSAKGMVYDILFKRYRRGKMDGEGDGRGASDMFILRPNAYGWAGRISRYVISSEEHGNENENENENEKGKEKGKEKRKVKKGYISKRLGDHTLYYAYTHALEDALHALSVSIDPNVTIDVHRIFRLAGTLNGKSSLAKVACECIDSFDPSVDACFIGDREVYAYIASSPIFRLKGNTFGPYRQECSRLPLYAFCYLACKGLATIARI